MARRDPDPQLGLPLTTATAPRRPPSRSESSPPASASAPEPTPVVQRLAATRAILAQLAALDSDFRIFGSAAHKYALNPPLEEGVLVRMERERNIRLPAEYRSFLTSVGNGGAGPSYGLFAFDGGDPDDTTAHDLLADPFPYGEKFNPVHLLGGRKGFDRYIRAFSRSGALCVCHHGCAARDLLVVSGPHAGEIWCERIADEGGLFPATAAGAARMSFLDWYDAWIARSLYQLRAG